MEISYDEAKRLWTLQNRGLDFRDVHLIFDDIHVDLPDDRRRYPEPRMQTYGYLGARLVMFAWTETAAGIRVISMRKCNDREKRKFAEWLGG
ncbi:MAG: BrnT family toxin [Blastomonas fulva]|uniref:BrnT family toxin n=1 Tax=Blastomonas fulva TaxID=1550728 RepID=UPI0024E24186|nr:BrnT family toxin [Blastomonas fulva]MDK2756974.1 BrnT family toxin [Blastomonas fulva]